MYMQFNDAARIAMRLAEHEARRWGHERVDTQHLLVGLFQLRDGVADRVLARGGVLEACVRAQVKLLGPTERGAVSAGRVRMAPGLRKAVDLALAAAERLRHPRVGTGHLLLGLLEEDGVACRALCKAGISRVGKNLSAVARLVSEEMDGAQRRCEVADKALRGWLDELHERLSAWPDAPPPPQVHSSAPATPPPKGGVESEVIATLSVALMVVAAINLLLLGGDVSVASRLVDLALFLLGAAGAKAART
jgi:hypothetical protein